MAQAERARGSKVTVMHVIWVEGEGGKVIRQAAPIVAMELFRAAPSWPTGSTSEMVKRAWIDAAGCLDAPELLPGGGTRHDGRQPRQMLVTRGSA